MLKRGLNYGYILLIAGIFLQGCYRDKPLAASKSNNHPSIFFPFFLSEKTMIVNREQDNEIEGHYLKVIKVLNDSTFEINLPAGFYITEANCSNWTIGWPTGKAYYDAGNENLRSIKSIDVNKHIIVCGKLLRGEGSPQLNQRIIFWNRNPSGFKNSGSGILVKPENLKGFSGSSMEFGAIVFDSLNKQWVMYLQEVDTTHVNIYAVVSDDLLNWKVANNGEPILKPNNFTNTAWAGKAEDGHTPQTARLYCALYYKNEWFLFLSGYGDNGKRQIGFIKTKDLLSGPFNVIPQAIITPGQQGADVRGCFYPKVAFAGNHFVLYYDGVAADGTESVCMAESDNLLDWKKYENNPVIENHYGWRSGKFTSEPNFIKTSGDTVWLMAGGYKKYNTEFIRQDTLEHRLPQEVNPSTEKGTGISGNVMDAELGVFISTDGGHTFAANINNPVWINDYSDTLQNDHIGGDFFYNGNDRIIYQGKSENLKRYNILLRTK